MKIKAKKSMLFMSIAFSLLSVFSNCKKEEIIVNETVSNTLQQDSGSYSQTDTVANQNERSSNVPLPDSANIEKDSIITIPSLEPEQALPPLYANAYNIEKALPEGYVKDGSVDYTNYVQHAINQYSNLIFPGFSIMINDSGLKIPSNRSIYFEEGAKLNLKASLKSKYNIIKIERASNVTLVNPYIIGDRNIHKGTSGEWGMGIGIYSSNNITIENAKIYNCWGDGIYIGTINDIPNENINLIKPYCKNNRRDGISIISVKGLKIVDSYTGYSNGTAPFCGINIEPNTSKDELQGIEIINPQTENNKGHGIQLGIYRLYSSGNKKIDINIKGHSDIGSFYAFKISNIRPVDKGHLQGEITIKDPIWEHSADRPLWMQQTDSHLKVQIIKPTVISVPESYISTLSNTYYKLKFGLKKDSEPFILVE